MKKGDYIIYQGRKCPLAKDIDDEIICIEYDYQACGGHIFPINRWVNMDEIEFIE
jgi:hypothetical protein